MWFIGLLQLSQVLAAPRCETFAPSGLELRDDGRLAGWSVEQLRGRRWSASVVSSGGGEELFDGYSAGRCVVGTWTKEEPLAQGSDVGLCLAKCQQDEGCLGILYGEVEGRQRPRTARCFLAGVGRNDVLMEYPGASSSTVTSEALMELAATLQCWQKLRQRCVVPPPEREKVEDVEAPEPRQKESVESVAGLLSELRSRLKSLPALTSAARGVFRSVQPGHLLLILGGFCRLFGRAADNADLAVQRCLKAAQATLEGPTGTTAICIIIFPIFGLLGQRLRSWQQRLAKWQAAKAAEKVHFSDMVIPGFDVQTCSSHQSVPMLLSSGMMPQTPTPQYQEERKPHGPGRAARHVVHGAGAPPARRGTMRSGGRVMTPPRPRRLQLDQLGEDEDGEFSTDGHEADLTRGGPSFDAAKGVTATASEVPLLQLLNHPDFEVLRRVRHLGDKTAQQIMSFRRRQGDLKTVSDLHTKVGLKEVLVKKVLKEYHVSR